MTRLLRAALLPAALLLAGPAAAQAPAETAAETTAAETTAAETTAAETTAAETTAAETVETAVLAEAASMKRWAEGDAVVAELDAGAQVQIVLRDGEQVRVQHQLDLGWIPASALQPAEDSAAEDAAAE